MEPLVIWKGERKPFVPALLPLLPRKFGTYYEPFFGGGSLYCAVNSESAVLSDVNGSLMNLYKQARRNSGLLVAWLCKYQNFYNGFTDMEDKKKDYALRVARYNQGLKEAQYDIEDAALLIYLNRLAENHLYHLNDASLFDVPLGGDAKVELFDLANLYGFSEHLQTAQILVGDYEVCAGKAKKNDFIYLDPPELNDTDSFVFDTFSLKEHERLAKFFTKMDKKGVYCMVTTSDSEQIQKLYRNYRVDEIVSRDDPSKRCFVIRNYA